MADHSELGFWRNWNSHASPMGVENVIGTVENSLATSSENTPTIGPGYSTLHTYPKESMYPFAAWTQMFTAAVYNSYQPEATQISTLGRADKPNHIHPMKCHPSKENEGTIGAQHGRIPK